MSKQDRIDLHADRALEELERARRAACPEAVMAHLALSELHLDREPGAELDGAVEPGPDRELDRVGGGGRLGGRQPGEERDQQEQKAHGHRRAVKSTGFGPRFHTGFIYCPEASRRVT